MSVLKRLTKAVRRQAPDDKKLHLVHEMAYYIEHADLLDPLETLTSKKKLMWKRFVAGIISGLVAAIGIALVLGLVAATMATF